MNEWNGKVESLFDTMVKIVQEAGMKATMPFEDRQYIEMRTKALVDNLSHWMQTDREPIMRVMVDYLLQ